MIREHTVGLVDLASTADLATPVATCGDWTLADLTWHLGEVQHFWAWCITSRPAGPETYAEPERPADDGVVAFLRDANERLLASLDGLTPDEPAWSWSEDETVGFTLRRQSHEALIHHIDGVLATGAPMPPVDPELATDGVDELVGVFLSGVPGWATFTRGDGVVRLATTDTGASWSLAFGRMTGTSPDSGRSYDLVALEPLGDEVVPDAAVSAMSVDLDLWLWGRRGDAPLTLEGDGTIVERLRAAVADATQ